MHTGNNLLMHVARIVILILFWNTYVDSEMLLKSKDRIYKHCETNVGTHVVQKSSKLRATGDLRSLLSSMYRYSCRQNENKLTFTAYQGSHCSPRSATALM